MSEEYYEDDSEEILNLEQKRKALIRIIKQHIKSDNDICMVISGYVGCGKSNCMAQILFDLKNCKEDDIEKKLKLLAENIIYDPRDFDEVYNMIMNLKDGSPIGYDEAQSVTYRRSFASTINKNMNLMYSKIRSKNLVSMFCIPDFLGNMDKNWVDNRVNIWIFIPRRGYAMVFLPDKSPFKNDGRWGNKFNSKIITEIEKELDNKLLNVDSLIEALKMTKNFALDFYFDKINPEEVNAKYLEYKKNGGTKPREDDVVVERNPMKEFKVKLARRLFMEEDWATLKIADYLDIGRRSINLYVKDLRIKKLEEIKRLQTDRKKQLENGLIDGNVVISKEDDEIETLI